MRSLTEEEVRYLRLLLVHHEEREGVTWGAPVWWFAVSERMVARGLARRIRGISVRYGNVSCEYGELLPLGRLALRCYVAATVGQVRL